MLISKNTVLYTTISSSNNLKRDNDENKVMTKNDQVSFQGLTRYFSNGCHAPEDLIQATIKYSKSNGVIGSLPFEWIQKIPKEERKDKIKLLYLGFQEAFENLSNFHRTNTLEPILNEAFKKARIIKNEQNIHLDLLSDKGTFGYVYDLTVPTSENEVKHYVIKKYKSNYPKGWAESSGLSHGNYVEQNRALFLQNDFYSIPRKISRHKKTSRKDWHRGDFTKIFFSDLNAGYAVFEHAKFLPKPARNHSLNILGLKSTDYNCDNLVNGYYVDYGGIKPEIPFVPENKISRYFFKLIKKSEQPLKTMASFLKNVEDKKTVQELYQCIVATLTYIHKNDCINNEYVNSNFQLQISQMIFDKIAAKIKSDRVKECFETLLNKMKGEQERRAKFDIDSFL